MESRAAGGNGVPYRSMAGTPISWRSHSMWTPVASIARRVPPVIICYQCDTEYRGVADSSATRPYDPHVAERFAEVKTHFGASHPEYKKAAAQTEGDPDAPFQAPDVVVSEGLYGLPVITHCCLEPHGQVAELNSLSVFSFTKAQSLAQAMSKDRRLELVAEAQPA